MQDQKGFTLIELMMAVAVIGILSAVAIPQYQNYIARTEVAASIQDLKGWMNAMKDHFARFGAAPTDESALQKYNGQTLSSMEGASGGWAITAGLATATVSFPNSGVSAKLANKSYTINAVTNSNSSKSVTFEVSPSSDAMFTSGDLAETLKSIIGS